MCAEIGEQLAQQLRSCDLGGLMAEQSVRQLVEDDVRLVQQAGIRLIEDVGTGVRGGPHPAWHGTSPDRPQHDRSLSTRGNRGYQGLQVDAGRHPERAYPGFAPGAQRLQDHARGPGSEHDGEPTIARADISTHGPYWSGRSGREPITAPWRRRVAARIDRAGGTPSWWRLGQPLEPADMLNHLGDRLQALGGQPRCPKSDLANGPLAQRNQQVQLGINAGGDVVVEEVVDRDPEEGGESFHVLHGRVRPLARAQLPDVRGRDGRKAARADALRDLAVGVLASAARVNGVEEAVELGGKLRRGSLGHRRLTRG